MEEPGETKVVKSAKGKRDKVLKSLSDIIYLGTGKVKEFTPEVSDSIPPNMMASYSEGKMFKQCADASVLEGWINHNRSHLSRIYPQGSRVDFWV